MDQVQINPVGKESKNPVLARVSEDGVWTLPIQGGKLKRGGTIHAGPGRPPKQQVRDSYLNNAELAVTRDRKVLENPNLPDDHPAVERAKERGARYGLGLKDEVALQDRGAVLSALARVTTKRRLSDAEAASWLADLAEELGIE